MVPKLDLISCNEASTLHGLFRRRVERAPDLTAYRQFDTKSGQWKDYSWRQMDAEVTRWRQALSQEGLEHGARVAVLLQNSVEWVCFDQAALSLGLVVVPLYTWDNPGNIAYILGDSGSCLLLVGRHEQWRDLEPKREKFPELRRVICLEGQPEGAPPKDIAVETVAQWLAKPSDTSAPGEKTIDAQDVATLVYTSGTTGRPKGVMLSHHNILWNADAVLHLTPVYPQDIFLSFLPLSHMFERTVGYYTPMISGSTVAYARSVQDLAEDLMTIRPTILVSVPRIYERVYAKLQHQLEHKGALARFLFELAVKTGWRRFQRAQGRGAAWDILAALVWPVFDRLVARKILTRLGGRLRVATCGGAPVPEKITHCFVGLGLPLLQGYGLTESSPVVSGNRLEDNEPASVGFPVPGMEIKRAQTGELLVRSPSVMRGYWNRPEETQAAIDADGWLHTGDIVELKDNRIYIHGRIKELIVTSTGEKIPPTDVEMALDQDALFDQAMVVGEGRPYLSALVVLEPEAWRDLANELSLDPDDAASLRAPSALEATLKRMQQALAEFPSYAQIKAAYLTLEPWSIEDSLITPTMKLKRNELERRFAEQIRELYKGHE